MKTKNDYVFPFRLIASTTEDADMTFGNFENPVSLRGKKVGSIYSFRVDPKALEGMRYAGFDIVSLANNHMWDYGMEAFLDTPKYLAEYGIEHVGVSREPVIGTIKGKKIGILAYTNLLPKSIGHLIPRYDDDVLKTDIPEAKKKADIVIVTFHWGDEYETVPNEEDVRMGRLAIDLGADMVIGHHPHVVQPVERYKHGVIAYSLGNFIFDQNFSKDTGMGMLLKVTYDEGITDVKEMIVRFNKDYQPYLP